MGLRKLAWAAMLAVAGCGSRTGVQFHAGPHSDGTGSCCLAYVAATDSDAPSTTTMRCVRGDYAKGEVSHADCGCAKTCLCHAEAMQADQRLRNWSQSPFRRGR